MQKQTGFSNTVRTVFVVTAVAAGSYFFSTRTPIVELPAPSCSTDSRVSLVLANQRAKVEQIIDNIFPTRNNLVSVTIIFTVEKGRISRVAADANPYSGARSLNELEGRLYEAFNGMRFQRASECIEFTGEYVLYPNVPAKTNSSDRDFGGPMFAIR